MATRRLLSLCALLAVTAFASPVRAWDGWRVSNDCYWCTRDAIYERSKLIALLEANPDVDEAFKGPQITAARAEIRALRRTLGPPEWDWATPCCYTRKAIHIR
jgi:hypothetical protein